jgi:hypothetical protein
MSIGGIVRQASQLHFKDGFSVSVVGEPMVSYPIQVGVKD